MDSRNERGAVMNFKELLERKNDLIVRAEEILDSAKTEMRELSDAEIDEIKGIKSDVNNIDETLRLDEEVRSLEKMEIKEDEEPKEDEMEEKRSVEEMEVRAFADFIRGNYSERGDDVNLTLTDNGAVIPKTVVNYIIRKVYDICPVLARSQKFNVKGTLAVPFYPYDENNITVAYQEEFVDMESTSGKFSSVNLTGFLAGALTKVSRSLVNNTDIDLVGFIVDEMAQAIARFIEHEILVGHPAGVNPDTDPAKVLGLSTLNNKITLQSASAITADDVVRLQGKVKDQFQSDAIWIMSPATREALRLLKDNMGHYMLNPDFTSAYGWSMLGKPVFVSDNMPDIAGGASVIYYGDFRGLATKFNEDINIQVLRERYAPQHALGIVGWFEFDARVIDEQQIAKLVMGTASLG